MMRSATFAAAGIARSRVRVPRILSTIFKVGYASLGPAMIFGDSLPFVIPIAIAMISGLGWLLLIISFILSLTHIWTAGEIEVAHDALVLRRDRRQPEIIPRASILGANVVRRVVRGELIGTVEVELKGGDRITVRVPDLPTARTIAEELGFGPGKQRSRSRLHNPIGRLLHVPLGLAAYWLSALPMTFLMFASSDMRWGPGLMQTFQMFFYILLERAFLRAPEVVVGDDGVMVERGFSKRFYEGDDPELARATKGVMADSIRAEDALKRARERTQVDPRMFDGEGRSVADWRRHLASSMEGGYRANAMTADVAASVLRSSDVTSAQRIGAGLALRIANEPARVRAALDGIADARVRVALEAIAEDRPDEVVERALKRLHR